MPKRDQKARIDDGLSERLTALMDRQGVTQSQLAEATGLSQAEISRIKGGSRKFIRHSTARVISQVLDVPVGTLIGGNSFHPRYQGIIAEEKHRERVRILRLLVSKLGQKAKTDPELRDILKFIAEDWMVRRPKNPR